MTKQPPKKKQPIGRPTKYKKEYAQQLLDYFNKAIVEKIETITEGTGKSEWKKTEVRYEATFFPTLELFANQIEVNDDTLQNWSDAIDKRGRRKHPEFFSAYTRAKRIQRGVLIQYAMIGKLSTQFATFFASANLGMTPNSSVDEHVTVTTRKHKS